MIASGQKLCPGIADKVSDEDDKCSLDGDQGRLELYISILANLVTDVQELGRGSMDW